MVVDGSVAGHKRQYEWRSRQRGWRGGEAGAQ